MLPADRLRKDWETRVRSASIEPAPNIAEAGLVLGAGTVLARRITDRHGRSTFAIDGNEGRILALLAVAYGRAVEPDIIFHLRRASEQYARGEIALALIHLARAGLARLSDPKSVAYRMFVGEVLLDDGLSPRDLLKASDIDPSFLNRVGKGFNVAEPRIPAGNGIESGEWTEDYGSGITPVAVRGGGERRHKKTGPEIPTNSSTPSIRRFTNSLNGSTSTKPGCWASPRMKAGISIRTIARSTIRSALLTVAVRMCTMTR
jgi:hypothetical protein